MNRCIVCVSFCGGVVEYNVEYKIGVLEGLFLNLSVAESTTAMRATAPRRFSPHTITEDGGAVNLMMAMHTSVNQGAAYIAYICLY